MRPISTQRIENPDDTVADQWAGSPALMPVLLIRGPVNLGWMKLLLYASVLLLLYAPGITMH